jgi:hypothetical protein
VPKQRYVIVLGANPQESHRYARRAGIPARNYRAPSSAASLKGLRSADVHLLPSFERRPDRHAIRAALRYVPDLRWIDVEMPAPVAVPNEQLDLLDLLESTPAATDGLLASTEDFELLQSPIIETVDLPEEPHGEQTGAPESSEDPAPVAPKRRRSRCKDCGTLHFTDQACQEPDPEPVDLTPPVDRSFFDGNATPVAPVAEGIWG